MNRFSPVALLLAACLASTVALAASDRVVATFESLTAQGITGDARLNPMAQGGTLIHVNLQGLQPNTDYVVFIYSAGGCASGTPVQIESFTANPAGRFSFNDQVVQELTAIGSISVQLASDQSLQACATVAP